MPEESAGMGPESKKNFEKQVDEEWKRRAQEEKHKAAEKARAGGGEAARVYPPVDFTNFVAGLGLQAMVALGQMENPVSKKKEVDLDAAQYTIDLMELIKAKTKGNLTREEEQTLTELAFQLKMAFIQAAK